jgi:hypothetical protein
VRYGRAVSLRRVAACSLLALAAAGCDVGNPAMNDGDCAAHFTWNGVEYGGVANASVEDLGDGTIGPSVVRGCPNDPPLDVTVHRVRGVDPSVAVGVAYDTEPGHMTIWGHPGYVIESPLHPLHRAAYRTDDRPAATRIGYRCDEPRRFRVRVVAVQWPGGIPMKVRPLRKADRAYLLGDGMAGDVNLYAGSDLRVERRHGIPFVAIGDRGTVVLRDCVGTREAGPGFEGLRTFVVDELRVS